MENNEIKNPEGLQNPEQDSEKVTLSKSDYEELMKNKTEVSELKTKIGSSTREAQKLHAISECARDDKYFAKVYKSDKKVANEVAKHFWYENAEKLMESLKEKHGDDFVPSYDPDEVKKSAKDEVQSELAKSDLQHFISEKKLKEWTSAHTRFLEEFNDLIDGKEMTRDNVAKYAKKARKILMDDDDFSLDGVPVIWRSGKSGQSVWATPQQKTQSIYERYGVSKDL